jgi:hypothetical protein
MKRATLVTSLMLAVSLCILIIGCSKSNPAAPEVSSTGQSQAYTYEQPQIVPMDPRTEKWGWTAHDKTTYICAKQWGLSDTRANYMSGASHLPDVYDNEGTVPGTQNWRHGWVQLVNGVWVWGSADAWCNANIRGSGYNSKSAYYYYGVGNRNQGDWYLGYASHYLEDVGNPWHTSANIVQQLATHGSYETWVENNWTSGWNLSASVANDYSYYAVSDPAASTRNLAIYSNSRNTTIYNAYVNSGKPTGAGTGNSTLVSETRTRIRDTGRYVKGLIKFTLDAKGAW